MRNKTSLSPVILLFLILLYLAGFELTACGQIPEGPNKKSPGPKATAAISNTISDRLRIRSQNELSKSREQAALLQDQLRQRNFYRKGFFSEPISEAVKERITGLSYKEGCIVPYEDLRYLQVLYVDFEGNTQTGELICHQAIAQDLLEIFAGLYDAGYEIARIRLIDEYDADDDLSIADNNTSCFNFRKVAGSANYSKHAYGLAVDINPFQNPYVTYPDGKQKVSPPDAQRYADRSLDFAHKIDENDLCYRLFVQHGFIWGGHWKTVKDYQHFQKPLEDLPYS